MTLKSLLAVAMIAGTTFAMAQDTPAPPPANATKTPGITKHQINQRARIHQGVKSGELTRGEAAKLRSEQRGIKAEKKVAKADGVVDKAERKQIRKDQNKASKDIYRLKHNDKTK